MIYDSISFAEMYEAGVPRIAKILKEIKKYSKDNYPVGRYEIEGNEIFYMLTEYDTHDKSEAVFEAHRKYIDVMYMVEGSESIYVKPIDKLTNIIQQYDECKECLLADVDDDSAEIKLTEGRFVVLFPQDAHAPACIDGQKKKVKKIIAKVLLDWCFE